MKMKIVVLGLSITSSWGNGHATTYRGLLRELAKNGHDILFLERDVPWYASHRDLPNPPYCRTRLYHSLEELKELYTRKVQDADVVVVGSYVPDGIEVGKWVTRTAKGITAFYDIDTPVTLAKLENGGGSYISPALIRCYDLYLSFTGGPTLKRLRHIYGAQRALPLYCSVDPKLYFPEEHEPVWDLGYMGTYSSDRQPALELLLIKPALQWKEGSFVVAGPLYPDSVKWPANVARIDHLPASEHRTFYNSQMFTLNLTRADMYKAGYSPSVRLFEAAACGVPIISDYWKGLETFFALGKEILIARSVRDTLRYMRDIPERTRRAIGSRARARVLSGHTSAHRAREIEAYITTHLEQKAVERKVCAVRAINKS